MMRRPIRGVMLVVAAVTLGACSTNDSSGLPLPLPSTSSEVVSEAPATLEPSVSTSVEPSAPVVSADEQAVLDAYRAFYAALDQAQADPPRSQDFLAPVSTGIQFETTNGTIKAAFLDGVESLGSPVLNPAVASIDGDIAMVHDCQDTSGVQSRQKDTAEVLTIGSNPDSATTQLTRVDGVWKVSGTDFPADDSAYCS